MSYFFAAFGAPESALLRAERMLTDVLPARIRSDRRALEAGASRFVQFGIRKPIADRLIHDDTTGSWLALLGTPLVSLPSPEEEREFLRRFLDDPARVLRTEVEGSFAVIAHDGPNRTCAMAADFNNTVPVYYGVVDGSLFVSSHELVLARFLEAAVDPEGFAQTVHLKLTWGERCRFKGIRKLLPCQAATFDAQRNVKAETYWRPADEPLWENDFDGAVERWGAMLRSKVELFHACSSNKDLVCDFTAGEDSRLLLSQCHASGLPFTAQVTGSDDSTDVRVAREASRKAGFELLVYPAATLSEDQVLEHATFICLVNDGYQDYLKACSAFATEQASPVLYYDHVKFCGAPGGEAFRGSYYLRGRAFRPSARGAFDSRFFVKLKYLLDFHPGLTRHPDGEVLAGILSLVDRALDEVRDLPTGLKIDHLLRAFQTCNTGLIYKNPRYLPFATRDMTRSIYSLWPHFKRGGRLTKACTEKLFPELAWVKTQNGVPTVRRTPARFHLFLPERLAFAKHVWSGTTSRLLKVTQSNKAYYRWDRHAATIATMLSRPPFSEWFASPATMLTGEFYNPDVLSRILAGARAGHTKYVPILGRAISQELAVRWVRA